MCGNKDLYVCGQQAVMKERGVAMMMTTEEIKLKYFKVRLIG